MGFRERKRAGYIEGAVSIIVNTLLFIAKYIAGTMSNSIAVIADSIHTLS
ncbi:MAG: cation transporter, partial [Thermosphaera sp.]|nr:cation transporter [Thermosphaera sp.]